MANETKTHARPDIVTKIRSRRVGDRMITVTIANRPAVIHFADILNACEVVPNDLFSAPSKLHGASNHQ